jgi:hypothetical protein
MKVGQGVKSPQLHHHNTAGQRLAPFLQRRFMPLPDCPIRATACHSVLAAGSLAEPLQPRPAHSRRLRWRRSGRPSRAGSAARRPRRNAPSDLTGSNARTELVYALSSQPAHHASPQRLGALARAHWQVEALHWSATSPSPKTPAASAPPPAPGHGHRAQPRDRVAPPGRSHPDRPHAALGQPESRPRLAFLGLP